MSECEKDEEIRRQEEASMIQMKDNTEREITEMNCYATKKRIYTRQDEKPIHSILYLLNGMCVLHFSQEHTSPRTILGLWQNLLNVIAFSVFCSVLYSIRFDSHLLFFAIRVSCALFSFIFNAYSMCVCLCVRW